MKTDVILLIPRGESNRITATEISRLTNMKGAAIRQIVNKSRADFVPIASDGKGYFMAETPEELDHTIAQINSRIHKMIQAREGLRKAQRLMTEANHNILPKTYLIEWETCYDEGGPELSGEIFVDAVNEEEAAKKFNVFHAVITKISEVKK